MLRRRCPFNFNDNWSLCTWGLLGTLPSGGAPGEFRPFTAEWTLSEQDANANENGSDLFLYFESDDLVDLEIRKASLTLTRGGPGRKLAVAGAGAAQCWRPGNEVAVTSSSYEYMEGERGIISSVAVVEGASVLTLESDMSFYHESEDALMAAEVMLLSRRIIIRGATDDPNPLHGGHLMVMHTHTTEPAVIQGVGLRNMGQQGLLKRYPLHLHMLDDGAHWRLAKNAIVDSNQRCIVIHGTDSALIEDNVAFDTHAHCYMVEDGVERFNVFRRNIGARTHAATALVPSERKATDNNPSTFWITNPVSFFFFVMLRE